MYENHRKSFDRDDHRDLDEDRFGESRRGMRGDRPGSRRGGTYDENRFDSDREWSSRSRSGYGSSFRDDDYGRYGNYGPPVQREYWRDAGRREGGQYPDVGGGASRYSYGSGQPYGPGEGDSRYFTGHQGSWALRSPHDSRGARRFGADYREHSYGQRSDDDERGFWDRATDEVASWFGDEDAARRREADHRGRGPKDYTRSDERIREDANDRLTEDYRVDASNITLTVEKGEITLNGTISSRADKRRAEDLVERISGVKHVQNNLRVAQTDSGQTSSLGTSGSASGTTGRAAATESPTTYKG